VRSGGESNRKSYTENTEQHRERRGEEIPIPITIRREEREVERSLF
jgi:hypothetical protein